MKRAVVVVARTGGTVLLGVSLLLIGCQSRLIYFPRPYTARDDADFVARGGTVLTFTTAHGLQRARFLPGASADSRLWIWCPGNAALALDYLEEARTWDPEAGWLFVDYPGYGGNAGKPSPHSVAANLTGAVQALATHLGTTPQALTPRLGAAGQSLGAAAALMAVEDLRLDRAVLLAPFTSMTEMGRLVVGWPLCHLNRHRYDNRRTLAAVTAHGARVWIVHGVNDEVIPVRMARDLAGLAPEATDLTEVPGARHNDIWQVAPGAIKDVFRRAGSR